MLQKQLLMPTGLTGFSIFLTVIRLHQMILAAMRTNVPAVFCSVDL